MHHGPLQQVVADNIEGGLDVRHTDVHRGAVPLAVVQQLLRHRSDHAARHLGAEAQHSQEGMLGRWAQLTSTSDQHAEVAFLQRWGAADPFVVAPRLHPALLRNAIQDDGAPRATSRLAHSGGASQKSL
eukprot:8036783-Alexandrium_andersonii.AAC.1